jgi:protein-disulfide isomerase
MNGDQQNRDQWLEDRLASLSKGEEVMIEPSKILTRLRHLEKARRKRQTRIIGAGVFALIACGAVAAVVTVQREDIAKPQPPPVIATNPLPQTTELPAPPRQPATLEAKNNTPPKVPAPAVVNGPSPAGLSPVPPVPATRLRSFKEVGSLSAPVTCEIYIDIECPPCAAFYNQTVPALMAEYVNTGKVKLLHRDFPLPQHKYARLAARYANAAGLIGKYDAVFNQLISTQSSWKQDGDIEAQLGPVLSPDEMQKLRNVLQDSAEPEESIARDRAAGADDHVNQTPTVVFVYNGTRRKVAGEINYSVLKTYLDELLDQH